MMNDLCSAVNELVFSPAVELIVPIYELVLLYEIYMLIYYIA
jgi:hypothetical protein